MSVIKRLTPEQMEVIPVYRQKWREIASNSIGANQSQVQAAIAILYRTIRLPSPKVQFFQGPEPFYQAFESYRRFRLAPNSLEDYERAIRQVARNALMLVMMVIMLCWMWSVVLLLIQFPKGFLGVILASLLWRYSPLKSVLNSQPKLARRVQTFIALGFLAWFLISPLVCAWVVRKNIALAWGVGILIAVALLIWLTTVLERRLLQSRWKQIIAASIRDQLSRKVRQQLDQIWAVDSLLSPSSNANPSGYFSSLKWSYSQIHLTR